MTLVPLPAFADNYIWMPHDGSRAIVADPVDPRPMIDALAKSPPQLAAILVTHHDADRTVRPPTLSIARVAEPADTAHTPYDQRCKASRTSGRPTLPSRIAAGRRIHPFLRSREATVIAAVRAHSGLSAQAGETEVFAALRQWKNDFR